MRLVKFVKDGKGVRREDVPGYKVGEDALGNLWAAPADYFDADGMYIGHIPEVGTLRPQPEFEDFDY